MGLGILCVILRILLSRLFMNEGEVKVSVLMLTYNFEKYVDEAIRGVMHQRYSHGFELVIGDDHSTDGTLERCRQWQHEYPGQIVLLENERNTGLLPNFIRTYNRCRGEYVAICEGDDYWIDRSKLQRQADFLDSHREYSMCVHRVVNYYEGDGSMSLSNGRQKADNDILDLARCNFVTNVSVMFRRANIAELPGWMAEVATYDYAMHLLNAQKGRIWYMNRCMAVYRKRAEALWSRAGAEKQYRMAMQVRKMLMRYFLGCGRMDVYGLLEKAYVDNAVALIRYYNAEGRSAEAEALSHEVSVDVQSIDASAIMHLALQPIPENGGGVVARWLKWCRRAVTRCLPVPHAR